MSADPCRPEDFLALVALFHRQLALDQLSPAARALEEKAILAEFARLRVARPGASALRMSFEHQRRIERALRFAHEIVKDELAQGHPGHDNVMEALEVILRPASAVEDGAATTRPDTVEAINGLATLLADAHTRLMCAGYPDDASLDAVKAARDWARSLAARPDSARNGGAS